jgi:hypothetical protein
VIGETATDLTAPPDVEMDEVYERMMNTMRFSLVPSVMPPPSRVLDISDMNSAAEATSMEQYRTMARNLLEGQTKGKSPEAQLDICQGMLGTIERNIEVHAAYATEAMEFIRSHSLWRIRHASLDDFTVSICMRDVLEPVIRTAKKKNNEEVSSWAPCHKVDTNATRSTTASTSLWPGASGPR